MSFYLTKRNQTYYYRIKIPSGLTHLIPAREIKQSLKTRNLEAAKVTAAGINLKVQSLFSLLRVGALEQEAIPGLVASYLPRKRLLNVMHVNGADSGNHKLSDVIALYVSDRSPRWTKKTLLEFEGQLKILVNILGDTDVQTFTRADCLKCRDVLTRLPANFTKRKAYKGKSITEILEMGAVDTLTPKTVNKYLVLLSTLFKWAVKNGYMVSNVAEGLSLPEEVAAHEERKPYDQNDLKRIVINLPRKTDEPEKYWIPLIAMHSGLRLDECCQLHVMDVREIDGVLCFDINDAGERKVKTQGSKRIVPVHPVLLGMGFGEYIKGRVAAGADKLWENLEPNKYGYWGKTLGNWYGRFNRKHITKDPKKVFHSFRHTVADTLKQKGVSEGVIAEILGHANQSITTGRYGKRYRPQVLLDALMRLDYEKRGECSPLFN